MEYGLDSVQITCTTIDTSSRFFRLGRDRGYFELIEYIKMGIILGVLGFFYKQTKAPIMRAWFWLIAILLIDNILGVHEATGEFIVNLLSPFNTGQLISNSQIQALGELAVFGLIVGFFFLAIIYHYRSSAVFYKRFSLIFGCTFFATGILATSVEALAFNKLEEFIEIGGTTALLVVCIIFYNKSFSAKLTMQPER